MTVRLFPSSPCKFSLSGTSAVCLDRYPNRSPGRLQKDVPHPALALYLALTMYPALAVYSACRQASAGRSTDRCNLAEGGTFLSAHGQIIMEAAARQYSRWYNVGTSVTLI